MAPCLTTIAKEQRVAPLRLSHRITSPIKALAGSLKGVVLRVPRLPRVVGPPTKDSLSLAPLMPPGPPCNIAVDPRICRGSVFAVRRQAALDGRKTAKQESKEAKYRVGVIRNQLEGNLPQLNSNRDGRTTRSDAPRHDLRLRRQRLPVMNAVLPASIDKGTRALKINSLIHQKGGKSRPRVLPPSSVPTPPCSHRTLFAIVETAVQTENTFEEETNLIVKELADSAIAKALDSLRIEEEITGLRQKTIRFTEKLELERKLRSLADKKVEETIKEKNRIVMETLEREKEAIASKALAIKTCKEVTDVSLEKMKELEKLTPKTKSIGMDTRPLNKLQLNLDLVTNELQDDFFPWIFGKAEKLFRNQVANVHISNGFTKERKRKSIQRRRTHT